MTDKENLRKECSRLFGCDTLKDSFELMDVYIELLFEIVKNHHEEPVYNQADGEAKLVMQMVMTKSLNLRNVVEGISYQAKDGTKLNKIIDPTIVACLLRNIYEIVSMFNLIYRSTKTPDEKKILYNMWVHSGLKYRQRFESAITTEENQQKFEDEKAILEHLVTEIEATELYSQLDEKNKNKIETRLNKKEYLMRFDDKEVIFLHWQELTKVMQIRPGLFDNIYNYFSLYAHPSNVSVFQFADMFKKDNEEFIFMTNFNLRYFFALTSIFIADYITVFPTTKNTFESMDIRDQIVINFHNILFRGKDYSINDSAKELE